jgi:hypothetical protein
MSKSSINQEKNCMAIYTCKAYFHKTALFIERCNRTLETWYIINMDFFFFLSLAKTMHFYYHQNASFFLSLQSESFI